MIFPPPRFVVVDDRRDHLRALERAFGELGAPCLALHYDEENDLGSGAKESLRGVRVLCVDLHLIESLATSDSNRHFAVIARLLEANISSTGGPFILVVWTEHENEAGNLGEYLEGAFASAGKVHARPLKVLPLAKRKFINVDDGKTLEGGADDLRRALLDAVEGVPQLAALLEWETEVQTATGATLSALAECVPPERQESMKDVAGGLGTVLAALASAAAGGENARQDPRSAVRAALVPLLADRVAHRRQPEGPSKSWNSALDWNNVTQLESDAKARINRMIHLDEVTDSAGAHAWGAVVELPEDWRQSDELQRRFAVCEANLAKREFKLKSETLPTPRLVRIGAVCDHAMNRQGPLTYLLGVEASTNQTRDKPPASVWTSPPFLRDSSQDPFKLRVNARFTVTAAPEDVACWKPVYRLREQLLMQLVSHAANHLSRPGILQL